MANEILGEGKCHACGAAVQIKLGKHGKAYYYCDGVADDKQCGANLFYGEPETRRMEASMAVAGETNKTNPAAAEPAIEPSGLPTLATDDDPAAARGAQKPDDDDDWDWD